MQGLGAAALASVGVSSERAVCVPGAASSLTPGDEHTHVVACSRELEVWQSCVSALSSAVVLSDKGVRLSEVASAGSSSDSVGGVWRNSWRQVVRPFSRPISMCRRCGRSSETRKQSPQLMNSSEFCDPGRPLTSGKEVACGMN